MINSPIDYYNLVIGKQFDEDGMYGCQCVDGFKHFCRVVYGLNLGSICSPTGYATSIWDNAESLGLLEYFDKVEIGPTYIPNEQFLIELSKKHKLFIVSNCLEGYIEIFLKKYKFEKYFIETANAASGITKAQNIKNLVEKHNLKTPIYVGDTIKDKESSKEAGVKFVYASYGFGEVVCDNKIEKLEDLLNL